MVKLLARFTVKEGILFLYCDDFLSGNSRADNSFEIMKDHISHILPSRYSTSNNITLLLSVLKTPLPDPGMLTMEALVITQVQIQVPLNE